MEHFPEVGLSDSTSNSIAKFKKAEITPSILPNLQLYETRSHKNKAGKSRNMWEI